jgi:hypothetical protein
MWSLKWIILVILERYNSVKIHAASELLLRSQRHCKGSIKYYFMVDEIWSCNQNFKCNKGLGE